MFAGTVVGMSVGIALAVLLIGMTLFCMAMFAIYQKKKNQMGEVSMTYEAGMNCYTCETHIHCIAMSQCTIITVCIQ